MKDKTIIFLGDGMADEPINELGGKTPLQYAKTPAMDSIARDGRSGTVLTLPEGFPTGSSVANMSVLGCDLATEFCGRGPLEAAGRGIPLAPDDIAFRANLVTVEDGVLTDFSGGHTDVDDAAELIELLNREYGTDSIQFHTGVSYRNLLILSGTDFSAKVKTDKPDNHQGEAVANHLPVAEEPAAEMTAVFLRRLMTEAGPLLEASAVNRRLKSEGKVLANGVWPWSGGQAGGFRTLQEKYGIKGAVITAVDVISGLGRCLGLDVIDVPGATGYIDTNYEGKADAAVKALETHDFVFLHVEAIDEVSHNQDLEKKIAAIEDFDSRVVGRALSTAGPELNVAVLPDHPVPISIGKHTRTPVPASVRMQGMNPDPVQTFDEIACRAGSLGSMANDDLMKLLFG